MKKILLLLLLAAFLLLPKLSFAQSACHTEQYICGGQPAYGNCSQVKCNGTRAYYHCTQTDNENCQGDIYCSDQDSKCVPAPTSTSTPTSSSNPQSCQTNCSLCQTKNTCGTTTYDTCIDDKAQISTGGSFCQNGATKFRCFAKDNPNCTSSSTGVINEYNYSCSACGPIASTPSSPQPTASPSTQPLTAPSGSPVGTAPKKPVRIIISQFERPDQTLDPSANLNEAKINLNFNENGTANVRFQVNYDSSGQDVAIYYVQYKLKQKSETLSSGTNACIANPGLPITVPVLVLEYYPPDPKNSNLLDGIETGWKQDATIEGRTIKFWEDKTQQMINQGIAIINEATRYHGYKDPSAPQFLNYKVIDDKKFYQPIPRGHLLEKKPVGNAISPDYGGILRNLNICDYVDNKGVKEVWMYGYHNNNGIVPDESRMSSKYGDVSNSHPKEQYIEEQYRMPICKNSYVLYNFTYQPTGDPGNNLHNRGHQIENIIPFAEGTWPPTVQNTQGSIYWGDFSEYIQDNSTFVQQNGQRVQNYLSSCGNIHQPPNWNNTKTEGYRYDLKNVAKFDCESWQPDISKTVYKSGSCTEWGCTDIGFYKWFMQNIPGYSNGIEYQGKKMRNWWEAMYDFNAFIDKGKSLFGDSIFCQEKSGSSSKLTTSQPTPTSAPGPLKLIDFNNDGQINVFDYIIFAQKKLGK